MKWFLPLLILTASGMADLGSSDSIPAGAAETRTELELLKIIIDQIVIEHGFNDGKVLPWSMVHDYVKLNSRLGMAFADPRGPRDPLGHPYSILVVGRPPKVPLATKLQFQFVLPADFWEFPVHKTYEISAAAWTALGLAPDAKAGDVRTALEKQGIQFSKGDGVQGDPKKKAGDRHSINVYCNEMEHGDLAKMLGELAN